MTESKDDDLLPQTSPEIIASPAEQDETGPDRSDNTSPQPQDHDEDENCLPAARPGSGQREEAGVEPGDGKRC